MTVMACFFVSPSLPLLLPLVLMLGLSPTRVFGQKIAIIGGGVAGSFAAKYLVDYDLKCSIEKIDIFDPFPIGEATSLLDTTEKQASFSPDYFQGGRVASVQLSDGTVVELGASVAYDGFILVTQMLKSGNIQMGRPHHTGLTDDENKMVNSGLGIYNGSGHFPLLKVNIPSWLSIMKMLFRYNIDLIRMYRATNRFLPSWFMIYQMLESDDSRTFFESPDQMWEASGLLKPIHATFDAFLDALGLPRELSWWRKLLPYQGSLRDELLESANLCNYNQDNSQLNGIVGLGSFLAATGTLYSVVGGNHQLLKTALHQARDNRKSQCPQEEDPLVRHIQEKITTAVGDLEGIQLYSGGKDFGKYDVVILAAPLQQCRIHFLIRSHMDEAVLQQMPLNGMVETDSEFSEDGHIVLPNPLPPSALLPYTQVVTTIVSNATLSAEYFQLDGGDSVPRSILHTKNGKEANFNITAVTQLTTNGVYKVFSSMTLAQESLESLFGSFFHVEVVKVWGGPYGGATPDYNGRGDTMNYLLHDSAHNLEGHTKGAALFYANMESSFSAMELAAISAKSVAKLVAKRFELIIPVVPVRLSEEL